MVNKILEVIVICLGGFGLGGAVWSILASPDFRMYLDLPIWAVGLAVLLNAVQRNEAWRQLEEAGIKIRPYDDSAA
jgi:hypothetical protein